MVDSQEFKEILDEVQTDTQGNSTNQTLRDLLSTYNQSIATNNAVIAQAELDLPTSGYDTTPYFITPLNEQGLLDIEDVSDTNVDVTSEGTIDASVVLRTPDKNLYVGYLTEDGIPPNGAPYSFGIEWPSDPILGQFHLRTDYFPNRLFRYDGKFWLFYEQNVRMEVTNTPTDSTANYPNTQTRQTEVTSFINNTNTATIAGVVVQERQALSKALRPKADN